MRSLVRAAVENKRTHVVEAESLEELCAIARGEGVDLVILDAGLPREDATMAYTQLKSNPAFGNVPVILLTDRAATNEPSSLDVRHPDRTLHKHFSPFELLNLVYTLTGY